ETGAAALSAIVSNTILGPHGGLLCWCFGACPPGSRTRVTASRARDRSEGGDPHAVVVGVVVDQAPHLVEPLRVRRVAELLDKHRQLVELVPAVQPAAVADALDDGVALLLEGEGVVVEDVLQVDLPVPDGLALTAALAGEAVHLGAVLGLVGHLRLLG